MKKLIGILIGLGVLAAIGIYFYVKAKRKKLIDEIMTYKGKVPTFNWETATLEKKTLSELNTILNDLKNYKRVPPVAVSLGGAPVPNTFVPAGRG